MLDKASYIRQCILERNIESCKDITSEQMEILAILSMEHDNYECIKKGKSFLYGDENNNQPLLVIELENESSVPKVHYKGKKIEGRVRISFDWKTQTEHAGTGGMHYHIEFADKKTQSIQTNSARRGVFA